MAFVRRVDKAALDRFWIVFIVVTPLIGVVVAAALVWNQYVFAKDIVLLDSLYIATSLGVGVGYHRMLTHQGFKASNPVRAFWLILGCMGFMGPPLMWAATHISHHAHSDKEGDPHSPLDGFWHAHLWWMFRKKWEDPNVYCPHLVKDPVVAFVSRTALFWSALSFFIPFALGGWTGLVWGGFVRIFLQTHVTWSVNSICHTFGSRPFESDDESRNEWVIGLLALGEGWHNNHHAFPTSAVHGLRWWQFDLSALVIGGMEKVGLVWDVQRVSEEAMEAKARKAETVRQALLELQAQLKTSIASAKQEINIALKDLRFDIPNTEGLQAVHDDAIKGLNIMQKHISKAGNFRKERLEQYKQELSERVAQAKRQMKKEAQKYTLTRA